jgi:signal transduction histidine kinase/CheY-like chemotaxis protein
MTAAIEAQVAPDVSTRVLLLAPTGRDSDVTSSILRGAGMECHICENAEELCGSIDEGAGIVMMTAEALSPTAMARIRRTLESQPAWSEVPLLIFVAQPAMERAARSFDALGPRAHVTLIDRPIHVKTLLSTTRTALRARVRQYEIRDLLAELQRRVQERDAILGRERAYSQRLAGLAEASLAIASAASLTDVLQVITEQACRLIDAGQAVTCMRVEEHGGSRMIRSSVTRNGGDPRPQPVDPEFGAALEKLESELRGTTRLSPDPAHPLRVIFGDCENGCLVAPLVEREGRTVGLIALAGKKGEPFNDDDSAVLTQLAQTASAAAQNARLYREAQEANRAKDDFLATLAHELRTPMTGILGWVQMLKMEDTPPDDLSTAVQMIEASTRVQARLVEDLLDVSRIIAGKLRIELAAVELRPVIETVVETFRSRAEQSNIRLTTELEEMPLSVYGDETRLHQVIWNLLSNALKFTPPGGSVHVKLERAQSKAIIRVTDTGQGIEREFLPHIFERFRQADNTTTRRQAGLGLGLAIVRHLVEMHQGSVVADSDGIGAGTSFTVTLPVLAVRLDGDGPPRAKHAPRLENLRLLIVDDDPEAGHLVAEVLGDLGAEVIIATSVGDAVRRLRSFPADIVISDIAMPGEDGYALLRRLREELQFEVGQDIHTLALTGYGRPEDRQRILASGFEHYIQKPVDPTELGRAIARLAGRDR